MNIPLDRILIVTSCRPVGGPWLLVSALLLSWCMMPAVVRGDAYARLPHGPGFRNVRDLGAKGDGITDDTQAFIRALEEGRGTQGHKSAANIYVPPGTYLVSDTLIIWRATLVAGDADDPPTIRLRDRAPGFGNPAEPKPLLVTAGGYNSDPKSRDWRTRTNDLGGSTNNTFFITLRNLKIQLGEGNPGAWGLYWLVAQQTALRHVTINAGTAQGCLKSIWWGGGGSISHLHLIGGDYGWYVEQTSQWVLRSARLEGQRKHSLWLHHVWNFSLLDLQFRNTAPMATVGGAVTLLDSVFEQIQGEAAIVCEGTSLVLQNVRSRGIRELVRDKQTATAETARPAALADAAVRQPPTAAQGLPPGEMQARLWALGSALVDGKELPGRMHDLGSDGFPARERLPSPPCPTLSDRTRAVTEFGARGDGQTDDTRALQRAVDTCDELFFPEGRYVLTDSLRLRPHTKLHGEMWSQLVLKSDSAGFQEPGSRKPLLDIPDAPDATLTVAHLQLRIETPGGIYCDWRAGENSMLIDTTFANENRTQTLNWRISGAGGGFFENGWHPGASGDGLEICSTGRKWLYAIAQEHYPGTAVVLRGTRQLVALGLQFEVSSRYVLIDRCEDIQLYQTIAGNWQDRVPALVQVTDSRNVMLSNSAVCQADTVVTEQPHRWNAGARSVDRDFTRQTIWLSSGPVRALRDQTPGPSGPSPQPQNSQAQGDQTGPDRKP